MKLKNKTTRELFELASELYNEYEYITHLAPKVINELKKRKISKVLEEEYGYKSIINELEYIV